jgi:hypothetical protein
MREKLDKGRLRLFLDIHAHSRQKSVFLYAPRAVGVGCFVRNEAFTEILDQISPIFNKDNCSYNTSQFKKNCARLGMFNNQALVDSYTLECSCWGYVDGEG